jgi:hypothetical protein
MNTLINLSAEALLAIELSKPEHLFTGDEEVAKQEFRALAARWHPDRQPDAATTAVFQHLNQLYETAVKKLRGGIWQTPGLLMLRATDGATYKIRYRKQHDFELGRCVIGREIVAYVVEKEYSDLFDNALSVFARLPCADGRMAAEMSRYLPEMVRYFDTDDHQVLVLKKTPDLVLLRDLLEHLGGRMEPRHVAWIISSLLNVACYLDYAGLAHNAILSDTWFVSPAQHTGALLGGWWYAVRQGQPMLAAPAATVEYAPFTVIEQKQGDRRTDLELIRAIGRELLGDASGLRLVDDNTVPPLMRDWLMQSAQLTAVEDYQLWMNEVLKRSFGKRRFVVLDVAAEALY